MEEIKIGSHVGMAGKEMFLASVKEAERYGANVLMLYTGAPQNTRRKEIKDLNIEAGWEYATKAGITPEYCAGYALKQMKRRKVLIVPTTEIKAATICGRFIPQNLLIAITAHQQKKKLKAEDI